MGKQTYLLYDVPNTAAQLYRILVQYILVLKKNTTACWFNEAIYHLERRGLSTPRRPDNHACLPLIDFETKFLNSRFGGSRIYFFDVFHFNHVQLP